MSKKYLVLYYGELLVIDEDGVVLSDSETHREGEQLSDLSFEGIELDYIQLK